MQKKFNAIVFCIAAMLLFGLNTYAQHAASLIGYVTDSSTGGGIPGTSVVIKGTTIGTLTDENGQFTLNNVKPGQVIQVLFLGYDPQEIIYANQTELQIALTPSSTELESVVVTALGIKRSEKALSYSVQQVESDELTTVKNTNFMNSLVGKVAGVQINANANGAGGAAKVVMRGAKSLTKDNNALYVIDGIPMNNVSFGDSAVGRSTTQAGSDGVADINPDDIESISVLSGPSAAALYGTDAANGVVMITTKKGTAGKTTLSLSNSTMFSSPFLMPEFQNTYGTSADDGYRSWGPKTVRRFNPDIFFNTGSEVNNSVSFSTGNDKHQLYASASTTNTADILPNSEYDRYNFSMRTTSKFLNDKLTIDLGANYVIQYNKNMVTNGFYFNPLPALYLFARGDDFDEVRMYQRYNSTTRAYDQYWPYQAADTQNPYWTMYNMRNETHKRRYMLSASLSYQILDWLNVSGRAKVDNSNYLITEERDAGTQTTWAGAKGYFSKELRDNRAFYGDVMLNIDKTFCEDFRINANIGASIKDIRSEITAWRGNLRSYYNFFSITNIDQNNFKDVESGSHTQMQSVFASAELSWRNMLYLTVTGRNDWASELAWSQYTSFFYPSVGLSAVVSEMAEMPDWFSYLKVRGSFSQVGSPFPAYKTRFYMDYNDQLHQWESIKWRPMANLKPEITDSWEVGVNARFFDGKLNFDFTYYSADTRNQTFETKISSTSGYSTGLVQGGKIRNSGIEMLLGYHNTWNDFSWATSYTLTYNKNKILKLTNGLIVDGKPLETEYIPKARLGEQGSPEVLLFEGGGMGDIYVNRELKRDMNGNIYINSQGGVEMIDTDYKKVGSLLPKVNMGWSNTFSYKGLDLNVLFSARIGGNVVSTTEAYLDNFGVSQRTAEARNRGGIKVNGQMIDAESYYKTISASGGQGATYVYDATNVRLQELSLAYTLPAKWFNDKMKMTVSLVGRNLWMIYNKAPFDPELTASTTNAYAAGVDMFMHPSMRTYGFSVKFQF